MNKTIAIIKGDGIGPEIVTEAMGILDVVAAKFGHTFTYVDAPMGGNAIDKFGVPLPDSSLATCRNADSVLLGAVGGPKWDNQPAANRPERGLLKLREGMGLYTNVRPAKMFSELSAACPLRADIAANGIDFIVVRELIGGVYFGEHRTEEANGEQKATDIMAYSEHEIKRVARVFHREREVERLLAVHALKEYRHAHRGHLVVGDGAARVVLYRHVVPPCGIMRIFCCAVPTRRPY